MTSGPYGKREKGRATRSKEGDSRLTPPCIERVAFAQMESSHQHCNTEGKREGLKKREDMGRGNVRNGGGKMKGPGGHFLTEGVSARKNDGSCTGRENRRWERQEKAIFRTHLRCHRLKAEWRNGRDCWLKGWEDPGN